MTSLQAIRAISVLAIIVAVIAIGISAVASLPVISEQQQISESCRAIQQFILSDVQLRDELAQQQLPVRYQKLNSAFANRWRVIAGGITCAR